MKALTQNELRSLFEAATNVRDRSLIHLLYSTGLRIFEAHQLTRADVLDREGHVKEWMIVVGKRGKKRQVYIDPAAQAHLSVYLKDRSDDNPYLWVTLKAPYRQVSKRYLQKVVNQAGLRAGVGSIYPHTLRATFLTDLERNGASLPVMQRAAGHSDIRTTQRYLLLSDTEMQSAIKERHSNL